MPVNPDIDVFIRQAGDFLAAYPSSNLSITYSNHSKRAASAKVSKLPQTTHSVSLKLYEPATGSCIKFRTYKSKEVSKLLNFIGPNGVNVVSTNSQAVGLASIMTNTKPSPVSREVNLSADADAGAAAVSAASAAAAAATPPSQPASKKSKKKGKKKN